MGAFQPTQGSWQSLPENSWTFLWTSKDLCRDLQPRPIFIFITASCNTRTPAHSIVTPNVATDLGLSNSLAHWGKKILLRNKQMANLLKEFRLKMKMPNDRPQGCRRCKQWTFRKTHTNTDKLQRKSFGPWTWAFWQLYSSANQIPCTKYRTLVINQYRNTLQNYFIFSVLCCHLFPMALQFLNYSPKMFVFVLFFISGRFY